MTTEGRVGAFPIKIRQIDINSVGVGGGSIATLGSAGYLSVGPRSAGAVPGPSCYGRGGLAPTITDADVVLGRLGVNRPLGGEIVLDRGAALAAVTRLATQVGLSPVAMAEGILRIAAVCLAGAIKEVSVMRGIDPRDFALLPFGGAGPLHAAAVAAELDMRTVVVPPLPGNFSALGLLIADVRRDFVRTRVSATAKTRLGTYGRRCWNSCAMARPSWHLPASRRAGSGSPPASTCDTSASRSSSPFRSPSTSAAWSKSNAPSATSTRPAMERPLAP